MNNFLINLCRLSALAGSFLAVWCFAGGLYFQGALATAATVNNIYMGVVR